MNAIFRKQTVLLFLLVCSMIFGCSPTKCLHKETLIQEEEVTLSKKYIIKSYITNSISDPEYAWLFINNDEVFRCRGASQIAFEIKNNVLTIYTNGNSNYEYDRIQKTSYEEIQILYLQIENTYCNPA